MRTDALRQNRMQENEFLRVAHDVHRQLDPTGRGHRDGDAMAILVGAVGQGRSFWPGWRLSLPRVRWAMAIAQPCGLVPRRSPIVGPPRVLRKRHLSRAVSRGPGMHVWRRGSSRRGCRRQARGCSQERRGHVERWQCACPRLSDLMSVVRPIVARAAIAAPWKCRRWSSTSRLCLGSWRNFCLPVPPPG